MSISSDSSINEVLFKKLEIKLVSNCLSNRKVDFKCDSLLANTLLDSVANKTCGLNYSLAKSYSDYDNYVNKLIHATYKSMGLSKLCGSSEIYNKSKMLLALLYECRIFKLYIDDKGVSQPNSDKYSEEEIKSAIATQYDTANVFLARLLNKKGRAVLAALLNRIDDSTNKKLFKTLSNQAFGFREFFLTNLKVQKEMLATEKQNRDKIIWAILATVSLGLLIFTIFNVFAKMKLIKQIQSQKSVIELQKKEVDKAYETLHEKNKEVMDSINYASRIQKALITSEKNIAAQLRRLTKKH